MTTTQRRWLPCFLSTLLLLNVALVYGQPGAYPATVQPGTLPPYIGGTFNPLPALQNEDAPYHSPDTPELSKDWENYNTLQKEQADETAKYQQVQQRFFEARDVINKKIFQLRLEELTRLKPSKEPDIDGSLSLAGSL